MRPSGKNVCVCFFFQGGKWADGWRDEKRLFFNGRSQKKEGICPFFGNRYFGPFFLHSLLGTARTN